MLTVADTQLTYKTCTKCQVSKLVDCFYKAITCKDGLRSECKECRAKVAAKYYQANAEKTKTDVKKYKLGNQEKVRASGDKYRSANPEKAKQWRLDNREKLERYLLKNKENIATTRKKYRTDNKEKEKTYSKQWQLDNPEKRRQSESARRARKLNNGVYKILLKELTKLYNSPCIYCGSKEQIQADHVIPIKRGGTHGIGNLVPACSKCNQSKGSKLLIEWKRQVK